MGRTVCRFRATSMNVAEWLRGLGLERYVPAFRDNDIDGEVLRRLTVDDLRELGIGSIGHRRRLLDAIAALGDGQRLTEISPAPAPSPGATTEAELRDALSATRGHPGPVVIVVPVIPHADLPGAGVWWDVAPAEVSTMAVTDSLRAEYESDVKGQRWCG